MALAVGERLAQDRRRAMQRRRLPGKGPGHRGVSGWSITTSTHTRSSGC